MLEAFASLSVIATLTAPSSLANDAMVSTRTTVDHRWPAVLECFVEFRTRSQDQDQSSKLHLLATRSTLLLESLNQMTKHLEDHTLAPRSLLY